MNGPRQATVTEKKKGTALRNALKEGGDNEGDVVITVPVQPKRTAD